jgi:predicted O-methyltransferase YrrM
MSHKTIQVDDRLHAYLLQNSLREAPVLAALREETARHPRGGMQISPEMGQLMQLLVRLSGARRALEVGVFTGYSSLAVALAMPADGTILACDVSEEYTRVARRYWQSAGVAARIELVIAPAMDTLDERLQLGEADSYDFAFIDADKGNYVGYYERVLRLLRPGGLLAVDNTLWSGAVADEADQSDDTVALRNFNRHLLGDQRVDLSLVPIGDGLTLARRRT